jgi:hypothetical protein
LRGYYKNHPLNSENVTNMGFGLEADRMMDHWLLTKVSLEPKWNLIYKYSLTRESTNRISHSLDSVVALPSLTGNSG